MKSIAKMILSAVCCAAAAVSVCACAMAAAVTDYRAADYYAIDEQLKRDVKDYHIPAMAVVVVDENGVLFSGTYGGCDNVDTPFIIGSLSKSVTALSIMQLAEQGRLNLDSAVSSYIDCSELLAVPSDGDIITVRELLHHTSGLGRHQTFANARITSSRGRYAYSNVGYDLLGKIIEVVSGESYADYVERHIFSPLDMQKSSATLEKSRENGLIAGYSNFFGVPVAGDYYKSGMEQHAASGYLSSSAADMGRYLQMYLKGGEGIISPESIDKMFYDGVPADDAGSSYYGMGWAYAEEFMGEKRPVLNHSGLVENYTSNMFIFPEEKIGVVVLMNMNDYLVDNNINGNILLPLLGVEKRGIPQQTYLLLHVLLDVVYAAVMFFAVYPLVTLKRWRENPRGAVGIAFDIFRHGVVAIALALLPFAVGADYGIAWRFVTDAAAVAGISSALLIVGGACKIVCALKRKKHDTSS